MWDTSDLEGFWSYIFCIRFYPSGIFRRFGLESGHLKKPDSARKECSNQKVEENKPALELNFT